MPLRQRLKRLFMCKCERHAVPGWPKGEYYLPEFRISKRCPRHYRGPADAPTVITSHSAGYDNELFDNSSR